MASEQTIFAKLESVIKDQEKLIKSLTEKLEQLQIGIGGGGGSASIEDFTTNTRYKRNVLVISAIALYPSHLISNSHSLSSNACSLRVANMGFI